MLHRLVLSVALASLVASAQPTARPNGDNSESWNYVFDSDDAGARSSYLGVDIADVTPERVSALKLKEEHGAEITMVDEDAPAGKAGLKEHDVILSLNDTTIESAAQLRRIIKETPPGRIVTLGISRDGQPLAIKVQLGEREKSENWIHLPKIEIPPIPPIPEIDLPISVVVAHSSLRSGLMVENISPQLGEFFGVKDGKGALIRSVEKGSRGEKAGFRAGDVIVKVNGQPVRDASDFTHALRGASGGSASVTVMRDKHEQNFTLSLPPKKDSGLLIQDSLDEIPDLEEESERALSLAENQVARLDTAKLQQQIAQSMKDMDCVQQNLQKQQKEIQERLKEQQKKLSEQERKLLERQQKFQHSLTKTWADI